ncbi:MAG: creatininase family protein, partial [Acidobacteria bacterium]|nr:creatininase family protein [Acidobacteriota bacterium]
GDSRLATAEMGRRLVEHYGDTLAAIIRDTRAFPVERLA